MSVSLDKIKTPVSLDKIFPSVKASKRTVIRAARVHMAPAEGDRLLRVDVMQRADESVWVTERYIRGGIEATVRRKSGRTLRDEVMEYVAGRIGSGDFDHVEPLTVPPVLA
ncbi:hypothetical protein ABT282_07415 [Streptomyces sp. NPDC000927]|uniref:hypothetical protein n=1 Tax=Streptomyces sp. NPDC000927 TaxID=3154371 RepID=UPI003322563E